MAGEPGPGPAHPGLKRPQGTASPCTSDYDLDHKLYREDVPYSRVYECQRIPPLINRVPVRIRRTQVGMGVKSSFRLHTGPRKSHLPREQIKRSEDSEENRGPELQQEPQGQKAHPEADSSEDSTDPKEAVKNPASDQEGSQ
ncbi:uncharacterized protein LOC610465 isoform X3 [Canis lupus familiaris]|uniref:uncharacterized protein LOC610465 isoform X3 n=1 Tax=Canis lupus familiaris TaxID=9615 RepID=UPI0018F3117A|nr:uncharacterized protein LOC610465 isoform X3 [Canis lupus familiaris]XP_038523000.1 uncharacterized protein LOC610465 isoform X3 [Canis lupus familiaris]